MIECWGEWNASVSWTRSTAFVTELSSFWAHTATWLSTKFLVSANECSCCNNESSHSTAGESYFENVAFRRITPPLEVIWSSKTFFIWKYIEDGSRVAHYHPEVLMRVCGYAIWIHYADWWEDESQWPIIEEIRFLEVDWWIKHLPPILCTA